MFELCQKAIDGGIIFEPLSANPGKLCAISDLNGEIIEMATPGGVMIDTGAMHGRYSVPMATKADVVYSFEPHPHNFRVLQETCSLSEERKKIIPVNKALGDKIGQAVMYTSQRDAEHSFKKDHNVTNNQFDVDVMTLDAFLEDIKNTRAITGIKIDVEGHEEQVLLGARQTLKQHNALIALEMWI